MEVESFLRQVFQIIGVMLLSFILWSFLMGSVGRTFMWSAIEPVMAVHWSNCTLQDGLVLTDTFSGVFEEAPEYTV